MDEREISQGAGRATTTFGAGARRHRGKAPAAAAERGGAGGGGLAAGVGDAPVPPLEAARERAPLLCPSVASSSSLFIQFGMDTVLVIDS
jgi:hypothetical protein